MPLPEDFASECLYAPSHWFVHDVLELSAERVVAWVDTTKLGAFVDAQQVRPGHPRHLPGAIILQITGTLGNLHVVYGLGLRLSDGWTGFGARVEQARFDGLGQIGPPVTATLTAGRVRRMLGRVVATYDFAFAQEGRSLYRSTQTAIWLPGDASPV